MRACAACHALPTHAGAGRLGRCGGLPRDAVRGADHGRRQVCVHPAHRLRRVSGSRTTPAELAVDIVTAAPVHRHSARACPAAPRPGPRSEWRRLSRGGDASRVDIRAKPPCYSLEPEKNDAWDPGTQTPPYTAHGEHANNPARHAAQQHSRTQRQGMATPSYQAEKSAPRRRASPKAISVTAF